MQVTDLVTHKLQHVDGNGGLSELPQLRSETPQKETTLSGIALGVSV